LIGQRVLFFLNPSEQKLAILAWKSPHIGRIPVTGSFSQFNGTCSNGIGWSVDKVAVTLVSGGIGSGGGAQTFDLKGIPVTTDEVLYFTVDSHGDRFCDEALLNLTITMVSQE
jgi:hypothetical protein